MTEAEWLACDEPTSMVYALHREHLRRKHLLFLCACFRLAHPASPDGDRATAVLERFADGEADFAEVARLRNRLDRPGGAAAPYFTDGIGLAVDFWRGEFGQFQSAWQTAAALARAVTARKPGGQSKAATADRERKGATLRALVRCVYGNPFRPAVFSLEWRTDTALSLARQMYDARDFSAMPILADALQDAGCDDEDVLSHCRGDAAHVRGCWVCDLVLGKE